MQTEMSHARLQSRGWYRGRNKLQHTMKEVDALAEDLLPADPFGTPFDPIGIELREVVFRDKARARP